MRKLHDWRVRQDKTSSQSSLTIHLKKVLVRHETIIFIFDWLDAQSDLSFRLSQMPFCLCCHVVYDFVSVTEWTQYLRYLLQLSTLCPRVWDVRWRQSLCDNPQLGTEIRGPGGVSSHYVWDTSTHLVHCTVQGRQGKCGMYLILSKSNLLLIDFKSILFSGEPTGCGLFQNAMDKLNFIINELIFIETLGLQQSRF